MVSLGLGLGFTGKIRVNVRVRETIMVNTTQKNRDAWRIGITRSRTRLDGTR